MEYFRIATFITFAISIMVLLELYQKSKGRFLKELRISLKGTVPQNEKAMTNDRLHVSKDLENLAFQLFIILQ